MPGRSPRRSTPQPATCRTCWGGSDSGPAFDAYATAWEADAKTLTDALHELADKIRASKGAYGGSDGLVSTQAARVRVGDGTVSTMPAYAERPSALASY
ncbi:hypothetical protein [Streptomyces sp. Ag109_G2-15]|uniref:hypothetical protein n=1 Tax=Streptomyces sp. Ag109_G2-15 TaxID=1938850 RepID=UPI000BD25B26|nr:hypothetical protein [Streptomyces sp. Ag109_G2-15]SOD85824.1 hypothetical protein SAMN06272765_3258 [Streptomyces sp. Ag109_G2-15]